MNENETYEQLSIGHLLKRQDELRNLISDPKNIGEFFNLNKELAEINSKLLDFYKDNNHNL